jgi:Bacterial protein of unknown function (DUF899)
MRSKPEENKMNHPTVVSRADWLVARKELLMKEKTSTRTKNMTEKKRSTLTPWRLAAGVAAILVVFGVSPGQAQVAAQYPPLSEYLMPRDTEVTLARSAAPPNISGRATIKVLTESGYQVAREGNNGFVCMVMRGWTAPTYTPAQFRDLVYDAKLRAPICFDPAASRTVMPYYELRSTLGMQGKTPDQIAEGVQAAYARGELPKRDGVTFAYMWSADQNLGPGVGHWHPHMMVFAPYYENSMLGGNEFGSALPQVTDDATTPFTVVVIPVDDRLAIKAKPK